MEGKKVSVVIPAYNCEQFVQESIDSILNQTYRNLEILIADDASTDHTRAIIETISDPRIALHHNEVNQGYLKTANKLLQLSSGDYITFQDADDWSDLNRIREQVSYLKHRHLEICGTAIFQVSPSGRVTSQKDYPVNSETIARNSTLGMSTVCYASLLFTREILESIGLYRTFFTYGAEDVDWFNRIIERYDCENMHQPLYYYRFSGSSITNSMGILKQIASLRLVRDLALERLSGQQDKLERGDLSGVQSAWNSHYEQLVTQPFSEELFKFNQLLRKHAYAECFGIIMRLSGKEGPWTIKLGILCGCCLKLVLGIDNYRLLRYRLAAMLNG